LDFSGFESVTLRKVDKRYVETFVMWCWRMMEISFTDCVKDEGLHIDKGEENSKIQ
jgi:hypothetical protein